MLIEDVVEFQLVSMVNIVSGRRLNGLLKSVPPLVAKQKPRQAGIFIICSLITVGQVNQMIHLDPFSAFEVVPSS